MCHNVFDAIPEISSRISQAKHWLVFFDLDGSFTMPVAGERSSDLWDGVKRILSSLVERRDVSVAVMSGQDRSELHRQLNIAGMIYLGNHGLEISGPGHIFVEPTATEKSKVLSELGTQLAAKLSGIPGAVLDDKGLTLSVRYGEVASENIEPLRHIVHTVLAASDHPFQLTTGENAFEIRPRVYWNKGAAVAWVKEQIGYPDALVIYVGDNLSGDNPGAAIPEALIVKVGGAVEAGAQFQVSDPQGAIDFLKWLDDFLQTQERRLTDERQRYSLV